MNKSSSEPCLELQNERIYRADFFSIEPISRNSCKFTSWGCGLILRLFQEISLLDIWVCILENHYSPLFSRKIKENVHNFHKSENALHASSVCMDLCSPNVLFSLGGHRNGYTLQVFDHYQCWIISFHTSTPNFVVIDTLGGVFSVDISQNHPPLLGRVMADSKNITT